MLQKRHGGLNFASPTPPGSKSAREGPTLQGAGVPAVVVAVVVVVALAGTREAVCLVVLPNH